MELESSIETTLNQIQKVMNANSIIGDAIDTGDKVIIPISKTALGFGVASGKDTKELDKEFGGAGGGGAINPVAVIIVSKSVTGPDGVKILPLDGSTPFSDILYEAGQHVINLFGGKVNKNGCKKEKKTNKEKPVSKKEKKVDDNKSIDNIKTKIKS